MQSTSPQSPVPDELLDAILADYLSLTLTLPSLAARHKLSIDRLIAAMRDPRFQQRCDDIVALTRRRARLQLDCARSTALATLDATLANTADPDCLRKTADVVLREARELRAAARSRRASTSSKLPASPSRLLFAAPTPPSLPPRRSFRTLAAMTRRHPLLCTLLLGVTLAIALLCPACAGRSASGLVAADHPLAAAAGAEILRQGGNAVDAAVATSFALSVVRPDSCGIGGGGFMIIALQGDPRHGTRTIALDYRERAPACITPEHFKGLPESASRFTGHAVAVPGTVAGLLHALDRYGTLSRAAVLAPAIRLAREGFVADATHNDAVQKELLPTLNERRPGAARSDDAMRDLYLSGQRITNPAHADALELIAERGAAAFYGGPIGQALVKAAQEVGGCITIEDLQRYRLTETRPLMGAFHGHTLLTMPLPSSGGVALLQIFGLLERRPDLPHARGPLFTHLLVEAFKFAFADRARSLADPEFYPDPTRAMLAPERLRARAAAIDPQRTFPPDYYGAVAPLPDDAGTSHFCVVDRWGSAVACTETINLDFGARILVPEYGFCLNNEMDDFTTRRGARNAFELAQSDRNLPAPGKRPLSSMCPVIVLDDHGVRLVAGASGGPRIITATAQVLLNTLLFEHSATEAVQAPRVHHQWLPNEVRLERPDAWNRPGRAAAAYDPWRTETAARLEARGHAIAPLPDDAAVQLIVRRGAGWDAAADPRKGGGVARE